MSQRHHDLCPPSRAKSLTSILRKITVKPHSLLKPYISDGMTVLDFGCGPGFFTLEAAKLVGKNGKVFAVDLQQEMLDMIRIKLDEEKNIKNVILRRCDERSIGITRKFDFAILYHVVHEVPDKNALFKELATIVKPAAPVLFAEPSSHVGKDEFGESLALAEKYGFKLIKQFKRYLSTVAILER